LEGDFKIEFRKGIESDYPTALVWPNSGVYHTGLPDFCVSYNGRIFGVEAKFVKEMPKRGTTRVLVHETTKPQINFLEKLRNSGGRPILLIGTKLAAVYFTVIKANYTLDECLKAPRLKKVNGVWVTKGLFDV